MPAGKFHGGPWHGEVHQVPDALHAEGLLRVPWPVRADLAAADPADWRPREPAVYRRRGLPTIGRAGDPEPWHLQA